MSAPWFVHEYVKRPVVIQAAQMSLDPYTVQRIAEWCGGKARTDVTMMWTDEDQERTGLKRPLEIVVPSLEGPVVAHEADYVIRGVRGEFYVCHGPIFEETYKEQTATAVAA